MYSKQALNQSMVNLFIIVGMLSVILLGGTNSAMAKSIKPITFDDCQKLTPIAMAEKSEYVMNSYNYLLKVTDEISDSTLRKMTADYLKNPVASVLQRFTSDADKEILKQQLVVAGYVKADATYDQFLPPVADPQKPAQPFYSAPGSGYMSHHAYPGGLVTHTAANVKIALGIYDAYKDVFHFAADKDIMLASEILHDMNKPWVFQWRSDYALTPQYAVAGTGSHHILSIAEAIYRGFPKEVIVAMACAHTPPYSKNDEKQIVGWIKAAAMIAGKDPVAMGLLSEQGNTLPHPLAIEGYITHLGDHDFVLTEPMSTVIIGKLSDIAKSEYGMSESDLNSAKFNAFRDYVLSQATTEGLYSVLVTKGDTALIDNVKALVTK